MTTPRKTSPVTISHDPGIVSRAAAEATARAAAEATALKLAGGDASRLITQDDGVIIANRPGWKVPQQPGPVRRRAARTGTRTSQRR